MDSSKSKSDSKFFISLNWKVIGTIILFTISLNALFFYSAERKHEKESLEKRQAIKLKNETAFVELSNLSMLRLQQYAEMIVSFKEIRSTIDQRNLEQLTHNLTTLWPVLEFNLELDLVSFFDHESNLIFSSSSALTKFNEWKDLVFKIKKVNSDGKPQSSVICSITCLHIVILPILSGNGEFGAILLGASLAETLYSFSRSQTLDVGILIESSSGTKTDLSHWNYDISLITNNNETSKLLRYLNRTYDLEQALDSAQKFEFENRLYAVNFLPLNRISNNDNGFILMVEDITKEHLITLSYLTENRKFTFITTGLTALILLLILWPALRRVKNITSALPLIAQTSYAQANSILALKKPNRFHSDEIDTLEVVTVQLSQQLSTLYEKIDSRTKLLFRKMGELKNEKEFIQKLFDTMPSILITLDHNLNITSINKHGLNLLEKEEAQVLESDFQQIFNSPSDSSEKDALVEIASGQREYFVIEKSLNTTNTKPRIVNWIHSRLHGKNGHNAIILSVGTDVTARKEAETRITWLANHDPLTGLYNRYYFGEMFERTLKHSDRYQTKGALMFLDLDNFKYINDTQGHFAGDTLIKSVSSVLSSVTRETDIVARIGGDEFAIVIPNIDETGATSFARKINNKIGAIKLPALGGNLRTTTSIGITLFPEHGNDVDDLLSKADIAMYQAKESGRSAWHLFSSDEKVRAKLESQITWKSRIEDSLKFDKFKLLYQPIVDIRTQIISHYEVLLRMVDANNKLISPTPFIQVAEKTGLIRELDQMVVYKAVEQLVSLNAEGKHVSFAINLSAHSLTNNNIYTLLKELLNEGFINSEQLIFEITETAMLEKISEASLLIENIQALGCRFALDDFGVGFSSFYYLKKLPIEYIKIDGAFIRNLEHNKDDQAMVRAITEVAYTLGKRTIAEFVENENTLKLLKDFQVDFAQGYFIGKPEETFTVQTRSCPPKLEIV